MRTSILWLWLCLVALPACAQQTMNLKDCIRYGLKNNRSISVSSNEEKIARGKPRESLATYLPSVSVTAGLDDNILVQKSVIPAGVLGPNDLRVAFTQQYNTTGSAQLDQVIFDKTLLTGLKANKFNIQQAELKKLLLLDACFSTAFDQDLNHSQVEPASKVSIVFRGTASAKQAVPNHNSKSNSPFEVMKVIFTDLRCGTGTSIISAASGSSHAYEDSNIQNGLFTYSLREALNQRKADRNKDGVVQVSELRDFVIENVGTLSGGQQKPTNRQENLALDFVVW